MDLTDNKRMKNTTARNRLLKEEKEYHTVFLFSIPTHHSGDHSARDLMLKPSLVRLLASYTQLT